MPDIKTLTLAAPIDEVLEFVRSEDFKTAVKELVFGMVSVRITRSEESGFNAWIGVTGEGSDVSLRGTALAETCTQVTLRFGLKMVLIVGLLFLPLCGLGLLLGGLAYIKKSSKSKSLGVRVGTVLTQKFGTVEPEPDTGTIQEESVEANG